MKKIVINGLFALLFLMCNSASASPLIDPFEIDVFYEWTEFKTVDGIKIEYKFQACDNVNVRNSVLVLFRFTNNTSETRTMTWATEEYRNDECYNCDNIDSPEYARSITLAPNQVKEADGMSQDDKNTHLFANFINLVPGMSNQRLTDFKFININVSVL